jgi:hypothetical protein
LALAGDARTSTSTPQRHLLPTETQARHASRSIHMRELRVACCRRLQIDQISVQADKR